MKNVQSTWGIPIDDDSNFYTCIMILTVGVSRREESSEILKARKMRIPIRIKAAGMTTVNAHIFLSRLKVSNRFLKRATVCAPNRDLEWSIPRRAFVSTFSASCA